MITKETLEAKLKDLAAQKEQALANLNALSGAEQLAKALLTELEAVASEILPPSE